MPPVGASLLGTGVLSATMSTRTRAREWPRSVSGEEFSGEFLKARIRISGREGETVGRQGRSGARRAGTDLSPRTEPPDEPQIEPLSERAGFSP